MSELILHRGAVNVDRKDLDSIAVPPETPTYKPISHYALVTSITKIAQDMLTGYTLDSEEFGVARNGSQFFGVLCFRHNDFNTSLSIGIRNSTDKSISVGLCMGSKIMCCDNLAFRGDITFLKKHTLNVWKNLEDLAISTLYRSTKVHQEITDDFDRMKAIELNDARAFMLLGLMYGKEIISPRQLTVALDQWNKPNHDEFQPRNLYSLYNGVTESLKSSAPIDRMDRHLNLHKLITLGTDQWKEVT